MVYALDYFTISDYILEVEKELAAISHIGEVIFDLLTSNGDHDRYYTMYFGGLRFDYKTIKRYTGYVPVIDIVQSLYDNGFRYDEEDNLWYDEHKNRDKYLYRIGISKNGVKIRNYSLFKGGYDDKIGTYSTLFAVLKHVK